MQKYGRKYVWINSIELESSLDRRQQQLDLLLRVVCVFFLVLNESRSAHSWNWNEKMG